MATSTHTVTPTFRQLPLPLLEPELKPILPPLPPDLPSLPPEQVWQRLPLPMQLQVRSTILYLIQEVLHDDARQ